MNSDTQKHPPYGFVIGLLAGTCVGAGLVMWLVPGSSAVLRGLLSDGARRLGQLAAEQYQNTSGRVGEAVDDLVRAGQDVRDDVAESVAVARGARAVDRFDRVGA